MISGILDARNMGQLRTQHVSLFGRSFAHACGVISGSPLSPDGGLSPKSVISYRAGMGIASLCVVHFPPSAFSIGGGPDPTAYGRGSSPDHARAWGLARWGHDPCPESRSARHLQLPVDCRFCHAPVGDLVHCLSECPWFEDLRTEWCRSPGIPVQAASVWSRHSWIFDNFTLQLPRDAAPSCEICWCSVSTIL